MTSKKPLKRRYLTIKIWCVPCNQPTKFTAGISNDLHTVCKECETHHPNCEGCGNADPVVTHVLGELVPDGLKFMKEEMDVPPGFGPRQLDTLMSSMDAYYKCPLGHA